MGYILDNISCGDWYIEHRTNYRWYLFDIDRGGDGRIEMLWARNFKLCLCWPTQEIACNFLDSINVPQCAGRCLNKLYLNKK